MPVHVGQLTADVTVVDGDQPLTDAQIERIAVVVAARLDRRAQEAARRREATEIRPGVASWH